MKILLLNDMSTPLGGAEIYCLQLRKLLRRAGHEVRFLSSNVGAEDLRQADIEFKSAKNRVANRLLQTYNPFAARALRQELDRFQPDVVHLHLFLNHLSPSVLRPLRAVPTVHTEHTYQSICLTGQRMLPNGAPCEDRYGTACLSNRCLPAPLWAVDMLQRWILNRQQSAINLRLTVSRHSQDLIGTYSAQTPLLQRCFSTRPVAKVPFPKAPPTACYIGRLVAKKGVDRLINAFAAAKANVPDARLLIAGTGPEDASLRRLAASLGLAEAVSFLGHVHNDDLDTVYRRAHFQVIPSLWPEPFGIVAQEAHSAGRPVIATHGGALAETVRDTETGYLVPPDDTEALANRLAKMLSDPDRCRRMGARALAYQAEAPTNETLLEQHLAYYVRAIDAFATQSGF